MYEKYRGKTLDTKETVNENLEHEINEKLQNLSLQLIIPHLQDKRDNVHIILLTVHMIVVHQK
jgi:hypothetical protein